MICHLRCILNKILTFETSTSLHSVFIHNFYSVPTFLESGLYFGTWCDDNFLHLNTSKTKELFFGSSKTQIHPSIDINEEMVERVQHFRYLGITLDDHLSFNQHILCIKLVNRDIQFSVNLSSCLSSLISFSCIGVLLSQFLCM